MSAAPDLRSFTNIINAFTKMCTRKETRRIGVYVVSRNVPVNILLNMVCKPRLVIFLVHILAIEDSPHGVRHTSRNTLVKTVGKMLHAILR